MNLKRENSIDSLSNKKIENHNGIKIKEISFVNKINLRIDPNINDQIQSSYKQQKLQANALLHTHYQT